jgi:hypothetical protein
MKESRIRGLTAEELEAVAGGGGHNGWVTTTTVNNGPGPHDTTSTTVLGPYGHNK